MARGIYFSGDLAAINQAMDSEERNRIAGRAANQAFLTSLAQQATQRRGQDSQERMGRDRNQTIFDTESMRTGSADRATAAQLEAARLQSGAQLDAARLLNERERQRIGVEADRVRALEAEGLRVDARAKAALEQQARDAEANRKQLGVLTAIQAVTSQRGMDPRLAGNVLEANLGIAERNQQAQALARMANQSARDKEWGIFGEPELNDFTDTLKALTPEQQALLEIQEAGGKRSFVPRLMQPVQAQQPQADLASILRLLGMDQAPSIATPPIAPPAPNPQPSGVIPAPQPGATNRVTPLIDITRGGTNAPLSWNGMTGQPGFRMPFTNAPTVREEPLVDQGPPFVYTPQGPPLPRARYFPPPRRDPERVLLPSPLETDYDLPVRQGFNFNSLMEALGLRNSGAETEAILRARGAL